MRIIRRMADVTRVTRTLAAHARDAHAPGSDAEADAEADGDADGESDQGDGDGDG